MDKHTSGRGWVQKDNNKKTLGTDLTVLTVN